MGRVKLIHIQATIYYSLAKRLKEPGFGTEDEEVETSFDERCKRGSFSTSTFTKK